MFRRITGLLLTASLTVLSVSQGASCRPSDTAEAASHHGVSMVTDVRASSHDCSDASPAQSSPCHDTALGDCASMSACGTTVADVPSVLEVAPPAHEQVSVRPVSALASRVSTPDTPPPRA